MTNFYQKNSREIIKELNSDFSGLKSEKVTFRKENFGSNILPKSGQKKTKISLFLSQFQNLLILILIIAGTISFLLDEKIDAFVIFITVIVNAIIGFVQEYKASQALEKLDQLVKHYNLVLRDGKEKQILSEEIVVGDILILKTGDLIPADGRIIESIKFRVNEAALTGEAEPQSKNNQTLNRKTPLADRTNMVYRGCVVISGEAKVIVTKVGIETEIGRIANLVKKVIQEKTPLQVQLHKMSKIIAFVVLSICFLIFALGFFFAKNYSLLVLFQTAVAVAVAAIPEGLVISLTIILAIGMQSIFKKRALVRKLVAAETLGSVSVICSDKTGTMTEGKMKIIGFVSSENYFDLQSDNSLINNEIVQTGLKIGILCNEGVIEEKNNGEVNFVGNMTDVAFLQSGYEINLTKERLQNQKIVAKIPFDSQKKFMGVVVDGEEKNLYVKGAFEKLIQRCSHYTNGQKNFVFTKEKQEYFLKQEQELTSKGYRVLACAYQNVDKNNIKLSEINQLTLVGLVVIFDSLRKDVKKTINLASQAGIKTIMITGDHVKTAQSIARSVGLKANKKTIFNGEDLDRISDEDLKSQVTNINVFARVEPQHKISIVKALQSNSEVVAMTGDGVNDAPALKGADIGIALGSGTEVAKEIADMVLLDDDYNSIVDAIKQGRGIYQNIKKVVLYLLSGSFAEVVMVLASMLFGLPLAALPVQILWVNLIEDSFPNIALAFDKTNPDEMKKPPRKKSEGIIDREMRIMIIAKSFLANVLLFLIYFYTLRITNDLKLARTMVFVGFAIDSLFYIFAIRDLDNFVYQSKPFSNKVLLLAVAFGWLMLIGAIYLPFLQTLLRTVGLGVFGWLIMIGFGLFNLFLIEFIKWIFIHRSKKTI